MECHRINLTSPAEHKANYFIRCLLLRAKDLRFGAKRSWNPPLSNLTRVGVLLAARRAAGRATSMVELQRPFGFDKQMFGAE
jgi:hypothetical protein